MPDRIKKIAFLVPRPGMSDAAFRAYWRGTHGPVVAGSPGYAAWRLRYVQNHVLGRGPVGGSFGFAGMAEFWLPGGAPNEDTFSSTPIYRDRIRVDELNFIDMDRTISMSAVEQVIVSGGGPVKLVLLWSRAPGLTLDDARAGFADGFVAIALADPAFSGHVRGWTASHLIEGSFRLPGARQTGAIAVDCVEEMWFASAADMAAAFGSDFVRRRAEPASGAFCDAASLQSFRAEELVFFDAMAKPA